MSLYKRFGSAKGQIAPMFAVALSLFLLGSVALGVDVVAMYIDWQQAQKVADAAAIAGANYLGGGITYSDPTTGTAYTTSSGCTGETSGSSPEEVASQVACTYATKNGLSASDLSINTTSSNIQVTATINNPYYFAKALPGMSTYTVIASASASGGQVPNQVNGSVSNTDQGMFPIGLQCAAPCPSGSLVAGESLAFGTKFISATVNASGNWDWLGPDGNGSSAIGGDITSGASGSFAVAPTGTTCPGSASDGASYCITTAPGNKANSGPIKKAFDARLKSCPSIADPCSNSGNPNDIPAGDPCLVIMPVVDFTGVNGSKEVAIEQFAEVYLEPDSTATNLDGCYISSVANNTLTTTTTTTTTTVSTGLTSPPTLTN